MSQVEPSRDESRLVGWTLVGLGFGKFPGVASQSGLLHLYHSISARVGAGLESSAPSSRATQLFPILPQPPGL